MAHPLAIIAARARDLPSWFRWYTLAWVTWGLVAPYRWLPRGGNVELAYTPVQEVVVNAGIVGGVVLLVAAVMLGQAGPDGVRAS